jgi:hypothetical protein
MITDTDTDCLKREYERGRKEAKDEIDAAKEIDDNILAAAIREAGYVHLKGNGLTMVAGAVATMQHLKEDLDASESRCHELAKRVVEHIRPVLDGPPGWRCFHCSEYFEDSEQAQLHFGGSEIDSPICQIHPEEIRKMEVELARYRSEDSDQDRKFHAMEADHATALQREEEKGYDKDLRDGMDEANAKAKFSADFSQLEASEPAPLHNIASDPRIAQHLRRVSEQMCGFSIPMHSPENDGSDGRAISRIHEMVMAVLEPVLGCCRSYGSGDTDCKDAPKDWAPTSADWCLHCRVREKLEQLMLGPVKKS